MYKKLHNIGIYCLLGLFVSCSTERFTKSIRRDFHNYPHTQLVAQEIQSLHKDLFIIDAHADSLLWWRDLSERSNTGHVDIPRLIEGNVAIQTFAVPTKVSVGGFNALVLKSIVEMENICALFSLRYRVISLADELHEYQKKLYPQFRIIKTATDLKQYISYRKKHPQTTAGILAIEGAHALENDINNIALYARKGYRMMSLTHLFDNETGGSSYGKERIGITSFGEKVLKEMERHHMIIDVAHASPILLDNIIALHKAQQLHTPLVASHTGVIAISPHRRNLSDKHIYEIAKTGGVICIGYFEPAIPYAHPQLIAESIVYVIELLNKMGLEGIHHVGLGSDFDGGVNVPFSTEKIMLITEALSSKKYNLSVEDIRKIMGENMQKLFLQTLPR